MDFIVWAILGGVAGWIASIIMGTDAEQGWMMNVVLGIIGAVIGGFLVNMLGGPGVTGFNLYSLLVAVFGAAVVIYLWRAFSRRSI